MNIGEILIAAASSSALTLAVLALVAAALRSTIVRSIGHQFDTALERTKSALKRDEEGIRAELAAQNARIEALVSDVLKAGSLRNELVERRRFEAIEGLWTAMLELGPLEVASAAARTVKMAEAGKAAAKQDADGRKMREFAETLMKTMNFSMESVKLSRPSAGLRLFAPPLAWALFSTYQSVVLNPVVRFEMMKIGASPDMLKDSEELVAAVRTALPHMNKFIDEHGDTALPYLVDNLRDRLFDELSASLRAPAVDEATIVEAAEIMKFVDKAVAGQKRAMATEDVAIAAAPS
jgi:hypothetical protein